jgi:CRISPR-associated protein Cas2
MHILISYDITCDSIRNKVAKLLEDHGRRVQYSVFECILHEAALIRLRAKLQDLINYETDSVRFYRLCLRCKHAVDILGKGTFHYAESLHII